MKTIHKYPVKPDKRFEFPSNWKIVHLFVKRDGWGFPELFVWVEKNLEEKDSDVKKPYIIVGTGWEYHHECQHLMTTVADTYVWHLLWDRS